MKPSRSYIFRVLVDGKCESRNGVNGRFREFDVYAFGAEQSFILACERVLGVCQYSLEILDRERLQLDADRETPLKFGYEVRRLGNVKRASGYEQYVISLDHSITRIDGGSFDYRQN